MPSILVATGFVRIDADTKPAMKALKGFGGIAGNLLSVAMMPAATALTAALGGITAATATAGAALGVYGVAVKQQFSQVQEAMQKQKTAEDAATKATNARSIAQDLAKQNGYEYGKQVQITAGMTDQAKQRAQAYNSALATATSATKAAKQSQEQYKTTLGGMPKPTQQLTTALQKLKDDTKAWSDSLAGSTMPVFTKGIQFLDKLLPKLSPIVRLVAHDIDDFVSSLGEGQAGKVFTEFGHNVQKFSGGTLKGLLGTFKNITVGIVGILNAFTPMSVGVSGGLEKITAGFANWGATLGKSGGFKSFTDIAKDTGPKLTHLLSVLADALVKVASAAGPLSGVGITLLTIFANIVDSIPTPVLRLLVPAILAVNIALKLYAIYTAAATAATWLFGTSMGASRVSMFFLRIGMASYIVWSKILTAATWLSTIAMRAFGLAMAVATSPITLIILGLVALGAGIYLLATKTKFFQTAWQYTWDFMKMIGRWFAGPFTDFFTKTIPHAFQFVLDWVKGHWPWLLGALGGPIGLAVVVIIKHWDAIKAGMKTAWDWILKNIVHPITNFFSVTIPNAAKTVRDKVVGWWNSMVAGLKIAWDWIDKHLVRPNIVAFTQTIPNAAKTLKDKVVGFWDSMKGGVGTVFNGIKSHTFTPLSDYFTKTIPRAASTMKDKVKQFFREMRDGIGTIWNGVKDKAKEPINWVLDHVWNRGIVSVWGKIAGWVGVKNTLGKVKLLAAGGTVGHQPVGMFNRPTAIVGEGNPQYPEYVIPTDPKYRNRGRSLWQSAGTHFMKDGGIIGTIGSVVKGVGGAISGAVKGALDFFSDPVGLAKKLFAGVTKGMEVIGNSSFAQVAKRLPAKAIDALLDKVKGFGSQILGAIGLGGGGGGSGVQRWLPQVQMALRMVGQVPALAGITLRRMNQESGGNPTIVNKWDSNWKAGHPSVGLMQVIGPTFRAYAGKFKNTGPQLYGVSVNPLANIYASMRYALAAYGSLARAYGRPGGYANGTNGTAGGMHLFGENGPEMGYSPAGWRILNARRTAGMGGGGLVIQNLVLENHGVIGSQHEVENWLVDSLTDLKRKGRLNL
jgi:hypothetical protein